jgi:hypothetical protein
VHHLLSAAVAADPHELEAVLLAALLALDVAGSEDPAGLLLTLGVGDPYGATGPDTLDALELLALLTLVVDQPTHGPDQGEERENEQAAPPLCSRGDSLGFSHPIIPFSTR